MRQRAHLTRVCVSAIAACIGLAVIHGCGAQEKGASAPPNAPAPAGYPAGKAAPEPMPAAAQPYATAPVAQGGSRALALSHARSELDVGERELVVAGGDCRAACRALGSMDRAAGHLCELANDGSERSTCEDAKTTLLGARDRVRTTCGSCPGGASVERTAPIPSVP